MADARVDVTRLALGVLLPGFTGTRPPAWLDDAARSGLAGVVLFAHNTPDVPTAVALAAALHEASPTLLVATDEEGGDVSRLEAADGSSLPGAAALGVLDDESATHDAGEALGRFLAAVGIDLDLAPVLDVNRPENPVIGVRAFGDTPWVVARHGVAFARGLHLGGVAVCAKHFPGHGATTTDSHLELPVVADGLDTLRRRDLVPFEAVFATGPGTDADGGPGVDALMTAHVQVPALGPAPASLEPAVVALARELGFDGPIITDALDMRAVSDGSDVGEVAVRAVEAGADLLCLGTTAGRDDEALFRGALDALVTAVRSGRLDGDRLVRSAGRTAALVTRLHQRRERAGVGPGIAAAEAERRALAGLGSVLARRAVTSWGVASPIRDSAAPDVVDLRLRLDHAAGRTAQHVQRAVVARWPDAVVHPGTDDGAFTELVAALAARGAPGGPAPLVVVTREPSTGSAEGDRLAALREGRPDLVVVHTGVPGAATTCFGGPAGDTVPAVLACGTGRANAEAAVAMLASGWGSGTEDGRP